MQLQTDAFIDTLRFLPRKSLVRVELACSYFAKIIDRHFSVKPFHTIELFESDTRKKKFLYWKRNKLENVIYIRNNKNRHDFTMRAFTRQRIPKYVCFRRCKFDICGHSELFFEHKLVKDVMLNLQNGIHEQTVVDLYFGASEFSTRKELSAYLNQKFFPLFEGKTVSKWHIRGHYLYPNPRDPEDLPLLQLATFRAAQSIELNIGKKYYETPRHRAILMLTTDEVVNWLHSETAAQSKIRTLKIENAGTLSHYNSWRSSDTSDLANEMFAKAKNLFLSATKPISFQLEFPFTRVVGKADHLKIDEFERIDKVTNTTTWEVLLLGTRIIQIVFGRRNNHISCIAQISRNP